MNKTLSLLLTAALMALLASCGPKSADTSNETPEATNDTTAQVTGDTAAAPATVTTSAETVGTHPGASATETAPQEEKGGAIAKGANLADALRAAGKVTYEYNADSGIWAHIPGRHVSIVISEDDLNARGQKIVNGLTADIEPDVALTPDCFKPTARIRQIEKD